MIIPANLNIDSFLYSRIKEKLFHIKSQSRGILRRHSDYKTSWQSHLSSTKSEILLWIESLNDHKELHVLGAGHLLDFPKAELKGRFKKIYLTDIDINCLPTWIKFANDLPETEIIPIFQDVSLAFFEWSQILLSTKNESLTDILKIIESLPKTAPVNPNSFLLSKNNLSLNLLSQIPIVWQEFVFGFLAKKFSKLIVNKNDSLILEKISPSARYLINSHLTGLLPRKNGSSLLISDLKYFFPPKSVLKIFLPDTEYTKPNPNVEYQVESKGDVTVLEQDALFGFDLKNFASQNKYLSMKYLKNWIWEIVPVDSFKEKREIHLVSSILLTKSNA